MQNGKTQATQEQAALEEETIAKYTIKDSVFSDLFNAIDVKVKVISENNTDSIINQYIIFCKVYNEQMKLYGRTKKTVTETIRICKDRNVLKEYLAAREKEVVSIMMSLFDEEEVMRSYIKSERYEAEQNKAKEKAKLMLESGKISLAEMPVFFPELSADDVKELKAEAAQLA